MKNFSAQTNIDSFCDEFFIISHNYGKFAQVRHYKSHEIHDFCIYDFNYYSQSKNKLEYEGYMNVKFSVFLQAIIFKSF